MIFSLYYIAIAVTLLGQDIAGSKFEIDDEPIADGSIVSSQLFDHHANKNLEISRSSKITNLHNLFESLAGPNRAAYREFYLKPLADLRAIVKTGNENACGPEMMEHLSQFHWNYVVGSLSKKWRKASNGDLPDPARTFFMNYAQQVTERCKDTLLQRLTTATSGNTDISAETLDSNRFGPIINQLSNVLQPREKIKKYDDFLLLWNQYVDRESRKGRSVEHKVDPATGEVIYMSFMVKDPKKVWAVQRKCRQDLRPIYRQTVLPVMRFISIGYDSGGKHLPDDITGSEMVKNWYEITQFCELILPVNFYLNETLQKEQTLLLTMDESNGLAVPEESLAKENPSANLEIPPTQLNDDILPNATGDQIAKLVRSNIEARSRIFKRVSRSALSILKSKLKNLFISKKVADNKYVVEDGESVIDGRENELLHEVDDDDSDNNSLGTGNKPSSRVRHKKKTMGMKVVKVITVALGILIMSLVVGGIALIIVSYIIG